MVFIKMIEMLNASLVCYQNDCEIELNTNAVEERVKRKSFITALNQFAVNAKTNGF